MNLVIVWFFIGIVIYKVIYWYYIIVLMFDSILDILIF